jgi:hypothetical protein
MKKFAPPRPKLSDDDVESRRKWEEAAAQFAADDRADEMEARRRSVKASAKAGKPSPVLGR